MHPFGLRYEDGTNISEYNTMLPGGCDEAHVATGRNDHLGGGSPA